MSRIYSDVLNYHSIYEDKNGVLKNKLGINTTEELQSVEAIITTKKISDLCLNPGNQTFDVNHYLAIHEYLFGDIYDFAGKIRSENIQKSFTFCIPQLIYSNLDFTLKKAKIDAKKVSSREEMLVFIAELISTLDIIHPFREGNGRTEREYVRQFMEYICKTNNLDNYFIDYSLCERVEYIQAMELADAKCDYSKLIALFDRIMIIKEKNKEKKL